MPESVYSYTVIRARGAGARAFCPRPQTSSSPCTSPPLLVMALPGFQTHTHGAGGGGGGAPAAPPPAAARGRARARAPDRAQQSQHTRSDEARESAVYHLNSFIDSKTTPGAGLYALNTIYTETRVCVRYTVE